MKKIVIIDAPFFLSYDANTNCLLKLINALSESGYYASVITSVFSEESEKVIKTEYGENRCVFVPSQKLIDNRFGIKSRNKLADTLVLLLSFLTVRLSNFFLKSKYLKAFKEANTDGEYEYLLSVSAPFLNHKLANPIARRNKKLKWIAYNLDPYSYNFCSNQRTTALRKIYEKKVYKPVYKVINTLGITKENEKHGFYPVPKQKLLDLPLPNLEISDISPKPAEHDKIRLCYAGMFYEDIRNPDSLIKLLFGLDSSKFSVEFYGGSCEYLKSHYQSLPDCIQLKGTVNTEKCRLVTESADILINVGNTVSNQTPSKIFEYISTGKPIVNLYYIEDDTSMEYLKRYPCIFNIRQGEEADTEELYDFCLKSKPVSKDFLKKCYNDVCADSVTEKFIEFIER